MDRSRAAVTHRAPPESKLDRVEVGDGTPDFSDQAFLCHVDVAQVQGVIDRLHLAYFDEPDPDIFSSCLQNPLAMILCLVQHLSQGRGIKTRQKSLTQTHSTQKRAVNSG